jgi:hypothetical protein
MSTTIVNTPKMVPKGTKMQRIRATHCGGCRKQVKRRRPGKSGRTKGGHWDVGEESAIEIDFFGLFKQKN